MYNDAYYKSGGPLFLFIGGEGSLDYIGGYLQDGLMANIAQKAGAIMYMLEHRFYGQSIPLGYGSKF